MCGCDGVQSALAPAGYEAERVFWLLVFMMGGAAVIWLTVIGTSVYAMRADASRISEKSAARFIFWGGVVFPVTVLTGLLTFGLFMMPDLRAGETGSLRIAVSGEQWWWRVRYERPGSTVPVESANEIRLPRGEKVELILDSPDVIHSFWIPSVGGKLDMIPGRTNRLVLEPSRTGTFRGVCAEYCGTSHALMAFMVVVMEPAVFDAWLSARSEAASSPETETARLGRSLFLEVGCGGCHTIRGTEAAGTIGPDLTHVGSRLSLGAGILPNDVEAFHDWIARTELIKPEARMPSFGMLPAEHLRAIAVYLDGLE